MPEYKVTPEEVPVMAALLSLPGWTPARVGKVFNVDRGTVLANVRGDRIQWKDSTLHQDTSRMRDIVEDAKKAARQAMAKALREAANELDPPEQPLTEHAQALKVL